MSEAQLSCGGVLDAADSAHIQLLAAPTAILGLAHAVILACAARDKYLHPRSHRTAAILPWCYGVSLLATRSRPHTPESCLSSHMMTCWPRWVDGWMHSLAALHLVARCLVVAGQWNNLSRS